MKRQLLLYSLIMTLAILSGCSTPKVLVPPRVPLGDYGTLGIIVFTSNSTGNLAEHATRKFMEAVQAAQPGVRILELGGEQRVLSAVEHEGLDFEAMRAIGDKWNVDAVFAGHLEVTDVKPNLDFTRLVKTMSLQADVEASLGTRLIETESGATVWTRGADGRSPVAHVRVVKRGPIDFSASDPEQAYGTLVERYRARLLGLACHLCC